MWNVKMKNLNLIVLAAQVALATCGGTFCYAEKVGNEKSLPVTRMDLDTSKLPLYDKILQMFNQPDPVKKADPFWNSSPAANAKKDSGNPFGGPATNSNKNSGGWGGAAPNVDPWGSTDPNAGDWAVFNDATFDGVKAGVTVTRLVQQDDPKISMLNFQAGDFADLTYIAFKTYNYGPAEAQDIRVIELQLNGVKSLKDVVDFNSDPKLEVKGDDVLQGSADCTHDSSFASGYACMNGLTLYTPAVFLSKLVSQDNAPKAAMIHGALVTGAFEYRRYQSVIVGIRRADSNGNCEYVAPINVPGGKITIHKTDGICEAKYFFLNTSSGSANPFN